jgi:hypothetical protein
VQCVQTTNPEGIDGLSESCLLETTRGLPLRECQSAKDLNSPLLGLVNSVAAG